MIEFYVAIAMTAHWHLIKENVSREAFAWEWGELLRQNVKEAAAALQARKLEGQE